MIVANLPSINFILMTVCLEIATVGVEALEIRRINLSSEIAAKLLISVPYILEKRWPNFLVCTSIVHASMGDIVDAIRESLT